MKKFICKLLIFITMIFITFILLFCLITFAIPSQFDGEWQAAITIKYNNLIKTNGPKIIYISGSSGTFCVDNELLSKNTSMPVVNLGLHAKYGISFEVEISKANIAKGDIIIIGFEENTYGSGLKQSDMYLMASGINDNIELMKYFSNEEKKDYIFYFPTYTFQKIDRYLDGAVVPQGIYSINSFDEKGNLIFDRSNYALLEEQISEVSNLNGDHISKDILEYFYDYREYVESKNATVVFHFPPLSEKSVISSKEDMQRFKNTLEKETGIRVINSVEDVMFEHEYLYDLNFHCNEKGQYIYTNMLSDNINKYVKGN